MVAGPFDFIATVPIPSIEVAIPDTLTAASPSIFIAVDQRLIAPIAFIL
jgi:hypothetical protein